MAINSLIKTGLFCLVFIFTATACSSVPQQAVQSIAPPNQQASPSATPPAPSLPTITAPVITPTATEEPNHLANIIESYRQAVDRFNLLTRKAGWLRMLQTKISFAYELNCLEGPRQEEYWYLLDQEGKILEYYAWLEGANTGPAQETFKDGNTYYNLTYAEALTLPPNEQPIDFAGGFDTHMSKATSVTEETVEHKGRMLQKFSLYADDGPKKVLETMSFDLSSGLLSLREGYWINADGSLDLQLSTEFEWEINTQLPAGALRGYESSR